MLQKIIEFTLTKAKIMKFNESGQNYRLTLLRCQRERERERERDSDRDRSKRTRGFPPQ
jgi:hypothetical protein